MQGVEYYGDYSIKNRTSRELALSHERVNLLKGLKQTVKCYEDIEEKHCTDWFNSKAESGELTDGIFASVPECHDPAFFHFTGGEARTVFYDLGSVCAVSGFRIGVLRQNGAGIFQPSRVWLFLSDDGENWQTAGSVVGFETWGKDEVTRLSAEFSPTAARYAKFTFNVPIHVWIDQIELFGCSEPSGAAKIVPDRRDEEDFPRRFASTAQLGAKDVMLAYMCRQDIPPISKEMLLPYVGYIEDGNVKDTMFDSFLFLPHVWYLYDYSSGYGRKKPLKKEDWQYYMDVQFSKGANLDALDKAAEEIGAALGKLDLRLTVFLSILYPVAEVKDFGVINGKNLDFSNTGDRFTALEWLIDEQYRRFNANNYKHLSLLGFYWFTEEISYLDAPLMELLRRTTDHVRDDLGLITTWIPYYHACGYNDWRELGFDVGCYQPNYAFNQSVPDKRLFEAAKTAKRLGMCIELEMGGTNEWNIERMKKYYAAGAITGYMKDAAHMYYQGSMPGEFYRAYESKDPYLHSVYKDTYDFIKGTFDPSRVAFDGEEKEKNDA